MPFVMTQFNGHMMELEVDCFDTAQEVKNKILNKYFRQIGSPDEQMSLEQFSNISTGFELVAYSRSDDSSKRFESDFEMLAEVTEDWFICMARIKQAAVAEVIATPER